MIVAPGKALSQSGVMIVRDGLPHSSNRFPISFVHFTNRFVETETNSTTVRDTYLLLLVARYLTGGIHK